MPTNCVTQSELVDFICINSNENHSSDTKVIDLVTLTVTLILKIPGFGTLLPPGLGTLLPPGQCVQQCASYFKKSVYGLRSTKFTHKSSVFQHRIKQ